MDDPILRQLIQTAGQSNVLLPSSNEIVIAKTLLAQTSRELSDIQTNIRHLQDRCDDLAVIQQRLEIAIAPHKHLPTELLADIFAEVVETSGKGSEAGFASSSVLSIDSLSEYAAWPLRQVCSRWRTVVLEHSNLWNKISIHWLTSQTIMNPDQTTRWIDNAMNILPREGAVSLDLEMPGRGEVAEAVINDLLIPLAGRLVSLNLCLRLESRNTSFFELPHSITFSRLSFLRLRILQRGATQPIDVSRLPSTNWTVIDSAQNLTSFAMSYERLSGMTAYYEDVILPRLNYSLISRLDVAINNTVEVDYVCQLLNLASNLESLTLRATSLTEPTNDISHQQLVITLQSLCVFEVVVEPGAYMPVVGRLILDVLKLPCLRVLKMRGMPLISVQSIGQLITRSSCLIEHVEDLESHIYAHPNYLAFWEGVKSLKSLVTDKYLDHNLILRIAIGQVLPHCKYTKWCSGTKASTTAHNLLYGLEAYEGNLDGGACFRTLELRCVWHNGEHTVPSEIIEIIQEKFGLDLKLPP
jgi:hypothetical protein